MMSLALIGLMLLAGRIYYKAVKVQRFLEPAVAISQPRIEFAQGMSRLLAKEFKDKKIEGVFFTTDSILVEGPLLLFGPNPRGEAGEPQIFESLAKVFISILKDQQMREHIDLILVSTKIYLGPDAEENKSRRIESQARAEFILNALYEAEPELERDYRIFFSTAAIPAETPEGVGWVEFKIVPTRRLHIDVLQRLERYVR